MSQHTMLVVDDEDATRQLERSILEKAGFAVLEAADGTAALEILRTDTPIELVVSDVDMPNLAGDEMAREVRAIRPGMKILFVTGHVPKLFKDQPVLDEDRAFLSKPFTATSLVEAVCLLRWGTMRPPASRDL